MGDIHIGTVAAGDEQGVAAFDQRQPARIEAFALFQLARLARGGLPAAHLDVLGQLPNALLDGDSEAAIRECLDAAIHAVTAAGRQLDTEQPQAGPCAQVGGQRVVGLGQAVDAQALWLRRGGEAGRAPEYRSLGLAVGITAADQQPGQQGEELAVLLRHMVADHPSADVLQLVTHTQAALDLLLAGMEGAVHGGLLRGRACRYSRAGRGCGQTRRRYAHRARGRRHRPGQGYIRVDGQVGDGGGRSFGQPVMLGQVGVEQFQHLYGAALGFGEVAGRAEQQVQTGLARTSGCLVGGEAQPGGHAGLAQSVLRQPAGVGIAPGQVHQDGLGVVDRLPLVHQHGHLAARVEGEEPGRFCAPPRRSTWSNSTWRPSRARNRRTL